MLKAAESLRYRDFLLVGLIVNREKQSVPTIGSMFTIQPCGWAGSRISRTGRPPWYPTQQTSLGMEYFVFENDDLWSASDNNSLKWRGARSNTCAWLVPTRSRMVS